MCTIVIHRANSLSLLQKIGGRFGVEIDVRHNPATGRLYLNHDPGNGDDFEEYIIAAAKKKFPLMVLNIKEAGIECAIIDTVNKYKIKNWFLLDVESPFIYKAAYAGIPGLKGRIAIRYSESEPIENALHYEGRFSWVWVDVQTRLPLDNVSYKKLRDSGYRIALVCPERWGRPKEILNYINFMKRNDIKVDAVMTSLKHVVKWEAFLE